MNFPADLPVALLEWTPAFVTWPIPHHREIQSTLIRHQIQTLKDLHSGKQINQMSSDERERVYFLIDWLQKHSRCPVIDFVETPPIPSSSEALGDLLRLQGEESPVSSLKQRFAALFETPLVDAIERTRMRTDLLITHVGQLLETFYRLSRDEEVSYLHETTFFLATLGERNRSIVAQRFGFEGEAELTLEELGGQFNVTRERIRQIVSSFERRMATLRPYLPIAEATVLPVTESVRPIAVHGWWATLPVRLRPSQPAKLRGLASYSSWGWLPPISWYKQGPTYFVALGMDQVEVIKKYVADIQRALTDFKMVGAAHLGDLERSLGMAERECELLLVSMGTWRKHRDKWFVLGGFCNRIVVGRVRRMLTHCGALSVDQIRQGLRRSRVSQKRGRLKPPPSAVLGEVLREAGFQVSEGQSNVGLGAWDTESCSGAELALLNYLKERAASTVHEILAAFRHLGFSEASARFQLSFSPLVHRLTDGVYCLRGASVSLAEIEAARARLASQNDSALLTQAVLHDGTVIIEYRLSLSRRVAMFSFRPNLLQPRSWNWKGSTRLLRNLVSRQTYLVGARPLEAEARSLGASSLLLSFNPTTGFVSAYGCSGNTQTPL